MEETLTLHDVASEYYGTRDLKIEADDWGLKIISPYGDDLYIELSRDRLTVRHYKSPDDKRPVLLLILGETS